MNYLNLVIEAHPIAASVITLALIAAFSLLAGGNRDVAAVIAAEPPAPIRPAPVEVRPPVIPRSLTSRHKLRLQIAHEQEEAEHREMEAANAGHHD